MTTMERKRFLALAGGSVLTGVGFLYPGAAEAGRAMRTRGADVTPNSSVTSISGADPTYVGGEVIATSSTGVVLRTTSGARAVRVPSETIVWREYEGDLGLIQMNDWLDAKGTPQDDGSLLATSGMVFANIGRADGIVSEVTGSTLVLQDSRGSSRIGFSPKLEVVHASDGSPHANGVQDLTPGTGVGAVGLVLPNGGLRATKIWTWD